MSHEPRPPVRTLSVVPVLMIVLTLVHPYSPAKRRASGSAYLPGRMGLPERAA